jgi:hypothetical protein
MNPPEVRGGQQQTIDLDLPDVAHLSEADIYQQGFSASKTHSGPPISTRER